MILKSRSIIKEGKQKGRGNMREHHQGYFANRCFLGFGYLLDHPEP